MKAFKKQ